MKSSKTWIIVVLTVILWVFAGLPFFINTYGRHGCLSDGYHLQNLLLFSDHFLSTLLFKCFASGFVSTPLIFITVLVLTAVFWICARTVFGKYAWWMLPFFMVMLPAISNEQQYFITGVWLSVVCLGGLFGWMARKEIRKPLDEFYHEVFHVPFWIYYTLITLLGAVSMGWPVLFFTGPLLIYRLVRLIHTFTHRKDRDEKENAVVGFTSYFVAGACCIAAFAYRWQRPVFLLDLNVWQWLVFGVFIAALTLGMVRRGTETPESKMFKTPVWEWCAWTVYALLTGVLAFSPLQRAFIKGENAIQSDNYAEVLDSSGTYLLTHQQPKETFCMNHRQCEQLRQELALQIRLALIMTGNLEDGLPSYGMQGMYLHTPSILSSGSYSLAKLYYVCGLYGSGIQLITYRCEMIEPERRLTALLDDMKEAVNAELQPVGIGFTLNDDALCTDRLILQKCDPAAFADAPYSNVYSKIAAEINASTPVSEACLQYYYYLIGER